ncbi:MAG: bleomycin resistance protein [Acidobacteriota bacterium]
MTTRLEAVHPVLMSSDVATSIRFYSRLGFELAFQDDASPPKYAALRRDEVEIHLQWHHGEQWAYPNDRPTYRFLVREVDALYAELRGDGALPDPLSSRSPWPKPTDTPWGTREFHVLDPDGNGLQFYRLR